MVVSMHFMPLSNQGLHSASVPGILALDLSGDSSRALTGDAVFVLIALLKVVICRWS